SMQLRQKALRPPMQFQIRFTARRRLMNIIGPPALQRLQADFVPPLHFPFAEMQLHEPRVLDKLAFPFMGQEPRRLEPSLPWTGGDNFGTPIGTLVPNSAGPGREGRSCTNLAAAIANSCLNVGQGTADQVNLHAATPR